MLPQKADEIAKEPNRAAKAALNAEQRCSKAAGCCYGASRMSQAPTAMLRERRKAKAALLEVELPHMQKLVRKGKTTPELIAERESKVRQPCAWLVSWAGCTCQLSSHSGGHRMCRCLHHGTSTCTLSVQALPPVHGAQSIAAGISACIAGWRCTVL